MLYLIAEQLGFPGLLNLIRYITFRAGGAVATALFIGMLIGPRLIGWLRVRQGKGQPIRDDGPKTHLAKVGTPTMGGLMILTAVTISMLLWMDLSNRFTWACLLVMLGFGAIGFLDDYDKVTKRSHKGVSGRVRLAAEFLIGGIAAWVIIGDGSTHLYLPFVNGPVADLCLLYARTDPSRGTRGITAFVVDMKSKGVTVAQKLEKMGFRGSQTAELAFDDCRVPAANVLGKENEGVRCIMSGLDLERAMISPICLGVAERALALSIAHAKERVQFGQPIANFQMIQSRLADMSTLVETMRAYNYYCLATMNDLPPGEGGRGEVHRISATSVMYCADAMNRVLDHAVQVHGGAGYVWETEMNRLYRATKLLEIGAGTTEVRKLIIAKELLA